ncbi:MULTISPECIES: hypothetical protein [unclassified Methylobacterium]|jgi:hypothetical protein|uniref:hypothetical protein n=1 Tax=unclassified Methylobacterium TaxID=2615210 RepID=UPI0011C1FBB0|nr:MULTISPECIES: hypothetical protein [unclassified Methylobacterium]QEE40956.1 hypothetical protein FVA80_20240 [Methylobacterium sp. WL1]TXN02769.1 hypothetical protein FV242_13780 [Methylobacterium sp. WL64]TXN56849.1 hypothetical protein FV241_13645 [Methylobacterium sp. WL2]
MSSSQKTPAADRHHGGPGSSHQDASKPQPEAHRGPAPGSPTSDSRSHVSGGGGERDSHHTHTAAGKAASRSH